MSTTPKGRPRPFVLIVLDGWDFNPRKDGNAIALAQTPNINKLGREWPHTLIRTSGEAVGLPEGQMGNSEVGHQNIGAGYNASPKAFRTRVMNAASTAFGVSPHLD